MKKQSLIGVEAHLSEIRRETDRRATETAARLSRGNIRIQHGTVITRNEMNELREKYGITPDDVRKKLDIDPTDD